MDSERMFCQFAWRMVLTTFQQTLLGGINMVDYEPWLGNYTGTTVHNNTIFGGFANEKATNDSTEGINAEDAIIKIGIAIGPRTWFGNEFKNNVSRNGIVLNNRLSGAFSYGIAISSATNFTVQGNSFFGNSSFIGARGPNCSESDTVPNPGPFITEANTTSSSSLSSNFVNISDGDSLTCVLPPNGGDFWPFGLNPSNSTDSPTKNDGARRSGGIVAGVIVGLLLCALATWLIRRWALRRKDRFNQF
jgi:parallel beta-helix repeat protein